MPLILSIVGLSLLRWFEIGPFADLSWWWIVALFLFAFIWFELIEPLLGLDKKKTHSDAAKARKDRVEKTFRK